MRYIAPLLICAACASTQPPTTTPEPTLEVGPALKRARGFVTFSQERALLATPQERAHGVFLHASYNGVHHVHGGDAAQLGAARLTLSSGDGRAHTVEFQGLEFLHAHCDSKGWDDRKPTRIVEVWVGSSSYELKQPAPKVELSEDGLLSVRVTHPAIEAYQVCDRFGYAVSVRIDGQPHTFELPVDVIREEP